MKINEQNKKKEEERSRKKMKNRLSTIFLYITYQVACDEHFILMGITIPKYVNQPNKRYIQTHTQIDVRDIEMLCWRLYRSVDQFECLPN